MDQLTLVAGLAALTLSLLSIVISIAGYRSAKRISNNVTDIQKSTDQLRETVNSFHEKVSILEKTDQEWVISQTLDQSSLPNRLHLIKEQDITGNPVVVQEVEQTTSASEKIMRMLLILLPFVGLIIGYVLYFLLSK